MHEDGTPPTSRWPWQAQRRRFQLHVLLLFPGQIIADAEGQKMVVNHVAVAEQGHTIVGVGFAYFEVGFVVAHKWVQVAENK